MAKMREDWLFIERMLKHKLIDLKEAKRMMSFPLYLIKQTKEFTDYYDHDSLKPYGYLEGDFILKDFAVVITPLSNSGKTIYALVEGIEDRPDLFRFKISLTLSADDPGADKVGCLAGFDVRVVPDCATLSVSDLFFKCNLEFDSKEKTETVMKGFRESIANFVVNIAYYTRFSNLKDQYMIGVAPTNSARKKSGFIGAKDIIYKVTGPRVIYLNEMPKTREEHLAEERNGSTVKPHHRRGFFKTLRAERFKNHPLYMKEKAIYTRPTWIGDKEKVVDGNVYTILEVT